MSAAREEIVNSLSAAYLTALNVGGIDEQQPEAVLNNAAKILRDCC